MGELNTESDYVNHYCSGITEYVLEDRTRVDCLINDSAQEYDWAYKWGECIGQALHYSRMTGKLPECVLIVLDEKQCRYYERIIGIKNVFIPQMVVTTIPVDCKGG